MCRKVSEKMKKLFQLGTACLATFSASAVMAQTSNAMNPAISMVLQGQYASSDQDPEAYELPGFMLGGESGLPSKGFGLGHGELVMSANVDNMFYGKMTVAIAEHEGSTEVELEEAYVETLGLGSGFTVKAGRFMSNVGYLNNQHSHAWDFIDAPDGQSSIADRDKPSAYPIPPMTKPNKTLRFCKDFTAKAGMIKLANTR